MTASLGGLLPSGPGAETQALWQAIQRLSDQGAVVVGHDLIAGGSVLRLTYSDGTVKDLLIASLKIIELSAGGAGSQNFYHEGASPMLGLRDTATPFAAMGRTWLQRTDVDWSSSDPSVATVNQYGIVVPRKVGSVTITARYHGLTARRTYRVTGYLEVPIVRVPAYGGGSVPLLAYWHTDMSQPPVDVSADVTWWGVWDAIQVTPGGPGKPAQVSAEHTLGLPHWAGVTGTYGDPLGSGVDRAFGRVLIADFEFGTQVAASFSLTESGKPTRADMYLRGNPPFPALSLSAWIFVGYASDYQPPVNVISDNADSSDESVIRVSSSGNLTAISAGTATVTFYLGDDSVPLTITVHDTTPPA